MAATREVGLAPPIAVPAETLYAKLSPGPGRSAVEVAANQRARIHSAVVEVVGKRGYGAVTVRELVQVAGVSTRAFYQQFEGKEECFLRTYELVVQQAAARIATSQSGERDWRGRLQLAFDAFAREIETKPRAARLVLVEAFAAGPAALDAMSGTEGLFEAMIADSFSHARDGVEAPPLLTKGIVAGVCSVARARLLAGRERELPELSKDLLSWTLSFHSEVAAELAELDRRSPLISELDSPVGSENGKSYEPENDRDLILSAVIKLAATHGYWQLTAPRIRTAAGVGRRNFDAHFDGVDDCFLAALKLRTDIALDYAAPYAAGHSWPVGIYRAIAALCTQIARDPVLAKLGFIEVFSPGPGGMRCREGITEEIAKLVRVSAPDLQRRDDLLAEASAGAVWGVLHHYVNTGRAQQLPRITATLAFLALAPTLGSQATVDAIRREQRKG